MSIIELNGLTKAYADRHAVCELNLSITKGEIFGLLGPNGAGKTTTILMLLGLIEPTSGSATICGLNSTRQPLLVKQKVGYLPDDIGFYEDRTGLENVVYTALLNRIPKQEAVARATALLKRVGLERSMEQKVGTYSRGMRQRLGLADVLIKQPEVLILDEPTLGLDPKGVRELLFLIQELSKEEEMTVLLSSHHLHQVQQVCDRVGLFVAGELVALGPIDELAAKLFEAEPVIIDIEAHPIEESTIKALEGIDGVVTVKGEERHLQLACKRDLSAEIARFIVSQNIDLLHLSKKNYGLDEIYHRYFEGGDTHAEEQRHEKRSVLSRKSYATKA